MKRRLSCVLAILMLTGIVWAQTSQPQTTPTTAQSQAAAQTVTIQGTVMKAGAGQALKRAKVSLRRLAPAAQTLPTPAASGTSASQPGVRPQGPAGASITQAVTDDSGAFVFNGVQPGDYRISADREGFVHQEYGQRSFSGPGMTITVSAGQRVANIDFQLISAGTLSGRIYNEDNEPVAGVQVQALTYVYQQGKRTLQPTGQGAQTNDLGEYRLYWLPPGDYYVSATARRGLIVNVNPVVTQQAAAQRGGQVGQRGGRGAGPAAPDPSNPPPNEQTYAPMYFPGTTNPENAGPVSLPPGAEMRGIDFGIRPMSTVTVSGQVIVPVSTGQTLTPSTAPAAANGPGAPRSGGGGFSGRGGAQINVMLSRAGAGRGFGGDGNRSNVRPDGTFDISGVIPGSYNLVAQARQDGQQYSARMKLDVNDGGVSNITIPLRAGTAVAGRIYVDGTPPAGFKLSLLRVTVSPTDDFQGGGGNGGSAQVADDSSFTLPNVSPMEYRVRVTGLPQGAYLMAGRVGNVDAVNQPFVITGDQQVAMQLQIGFSAGQVQGSVIDAKGNPYQGALTALVPDEARRQRPELFFSAPTDQSGHFSFTSVPPGSYKLFAWEDIPAGAYQDPDFIRRYEDRGKPVKVDAGGSVDADLPLITSLQ